MSTALEPLAAGQRMTRAEFHERYKEAPPGLRFELIEGKVYMASPVSDAHNEKCGLAGGWLSHYAFRTPGVRVGHDGTVMLGDRAEVQPDVMLKVDPRCGGRARREGAYLAACPELVIEVALSSRAVDLGPKLADYDRAGALEYIVFALEPDEIFWHVRRDGRLVRVSAEADGIHRSVAFPGLWLEAAAWHADDGPALVAALDLGLATPGHAAFVARLAAARGADG